MTKETLRNEVQFLFDDAKEKSIDVYALVRDSYYKLDLLQNSKSDLLTLFVGGVKKNVIDNEKFIIRPYSTSDERKNCYYEYDLTEIPTEIQTMNALVGVQDVEPYRVDELSTLNDIDALYIVLSHQNEVVVLYKNISQLDFVDVHQRFLLIKNSDHQLTKLDKDYLRISSSFHIIRTVSGTVILDITPLENSSGFDQIVKNEVNIRIGDIEAIGLIENMDSFKGYLDNLSSKKALLQLKNSQVIKKHVSAADIVKFAVDKKDVIGKIQLSDDKTKLSPSSKNQTRILLKLLNDDFVISELTKSDYDAIAKDKLEKVTE